MANARGGLLAAAVAAGTAVTLGCASGAPQEVELPPQTLTAAPTSTAAEESALVSGPEARAEVAETPPVDSPSDAEPSSSRRQTIVIQSGGGDDVTPRSLYEASAVERQRRASAQQPVAVITNQNLAEQAAGGQLTVLAPEAEGARRDQAAPGAAAESAAPASGGSGEGAAAAVASSTLTEEYWRGQALKIRLDWKAAVEEIEELETEVAELRRRFYEEDDPFYRDNQIKPEWDRALDHLGEARTAAEEHERKLARFLEDGRRAGALPGWLREGIEFEPPATAQRTPAHERRSDDPWEPKILNEDARDP